jgi:hypothetical protein
LKRRKTGNGVLQGLKTGKRRDWDQWKKSEVGDNTMRALSLSLSLSPYIYI